MQGVSGRGTPTPSFLQILVTLFFISLLGCAWWVACTTETIPLYPAGREADALDSRESDVLDRCGVIS